MTLSFDGIDVLGEDTVSRTTLRTLTDKTKVTFSNVTSREVLCAEGHTLCSSTFRSSLLRDVYFEVVTGVIQLY